MKTPEKIYVTPNFDRRWQTKAIDDESVEYVCTNTFIEKAAEWLEENLTEYCDGEDIEYTSISTYNVMILQNERMIEDFRNYMKGE